MNELYRPTFVEINLNAIRENVRAIRQHVGPGVKIMPAVKADGYGHGSVQVSQAAIDGGADMLGVASIEEAITLRDGGITAPILILGCSTRDGLSDIVEYGISATVCEPGFALDLAKEADKRGKPALIHVKVDTGMGRIGVPAEKTVDLVSEIARSPGLCLEGLFTHFPTSDEPDRSFTQHQISVFSEVSKTLKTAGMSPKISHTANSGAILDYPESRFDMVRPGIIVYGLYPSPDSTRSIPLTPALTFKTRVTFVKRVPAGTSVSYGRTFVTKRPSVVATIAVGYADGYSRTLSNRGFVAIRGQKAPVIGRVCMDQTLIDVTDVPGADVGDEVTLLGGPHDFLAVEEIAEMMGTIPHDVVCAIGKRVPRVYTE